MSHLHVSPHVAQVTKSFVEGSIVTLVAVVSAVIAVTLVYVWFFT